MRRMRREAGENVFNKRAKRTFSFSESKQFDGNYDRSSGTDGEEDKKMGLTASCGGDNIVDVEDSTNGAILRWQQTTCNRSLLGYILSRQNTNFSV